MDDFDALAADAATLAAALTARGWRMATAESCTGGLIGAVCTSLAGSSGWYERGFITYSNAAKADSLGVEMALIDAHGAVSEQVALAMAEGALRHSLADVAVSVTGIAGPGGATEGKPVGTVWLATALRVSGGRALLRSERCQFAGDRSRVRSDTVARALAMLQELAR